VWTRDLVIVACCLTPSSVLAAVGSFPEGAEVVSTPAPYAQASAPMSGEMACDASGTPPTTPWYYWWSSWHWFDRGHDRGQHYAYLPPLPGWYYFRPYSVGQLRAQQEAVMKWGGDPRNPYATGVLPQLPQPHASPSAPSATASTRTGAAGFAIVASSPAPSEPAAAVIPWPSALQSSLFANQRARIEAPYRRSLRGQANPTAADYQNMIDAAEQMKAVLTQRTANISAQDSLSAEKFLDQLVAEARGYVQTRLASASSEPYSVNSPTSEPNREPE
jgi:hypothetical protein